VPHRPRYRYFSNPPSTVSLRLGDLAPQIPEAARLSGFNAEKTVELPCEEIFAGPVPKLSLSRLAELAKEDVSTEGIAESSIQLPIVRLALSFRFIHGRELIEEPPPPKPERSQEDFAPRDGPFKAGHEPTEATDSRADQTASNSPAEAIDASQSSSALGGPPPELGSGGGVTDEIKPGEPETWRPITAFPIFRRKSAEPQVKPPVAPLRPMVEGPPPRAPGTRTDSGQPEEATKVPSAAAPPKDSAPTVPEAVLVGTERSHAPSRRIEIVDQDALQAVFMTEEMLSVDRVVELCGALPGIRSCILAHGAAVLASNNVPESIDLVSLSAHALEMLAAMRQSAARMGIGAVPAVTIHAEKGPITFFHQDDLCLLVMHKDRGFVPGVREKLQKVVEHLAQGHPALGADDSLPWGAKRPGT
jgi:predicted regulator of Ras-like GTPase activity (Roadblock/LC7/MglB family)